MSSASPTRSNESSQFFTKNIKINLNSKFIPLDFFPQSISQLTKRVKKFSNSSKCSAQQKKPSIQRLNPQKFQIDQEVRNLQLLKKRLIRIKQSNQTQFNSEECKKISLKKRQNSKEGFKKSIQKLKSNDKISIKQKKKGGGYSKKVMDYMQKMKNVINIDIKFDQDQIFNVNQRYNDQIKKQKNQDVQTDDSPKPFKRRPKSQINSRERMISKQKANLQYKITPINPIKIKVKQVSKIMRQSLEKQNKRACRYNKFIDIPLDQQGMLTFYGSPDTKSKSSYDSKKYSIRTSLPKLSQ